MKQILTSLAVIAALYGIPAASVRAQYVNWTGANGTDWSDDGNWSGVLGTGSTARFNSAFTNQPELTQDVTVGAININSTTVPEFTIGGAGYTLTLGNNGDSIYLQNSGGDVTFAANVNSLGAARIRNTVAGYALTFAGTYSFATSSTVGAGTDTGLVVFNQISSAGTLNVGGGRVQFNADNAATFSGTTLINGGTVAVGNNNAFGTGALTIGGAVAVIKSASAAAVTINNALTIGGTANFGSADSGDLNFATVTAQNTKGASVQNGQTTFNYFSNANAKNANVFTKTGTGALVIQDGQFRSLFAVNGGTLLINASFNDQYATTASVVASGAALGGTGTVSGTWNVNDSGKLTSAYGGLTFFGGGLNLASGSIYEYGGAAINVTGVLTLTDGWELYFADGSNWQLGTAADTVTLFDFGTQGSSFDLNGVTISGLSFDTGSLGFAVEGNQLKLYGIIAIPEPSIWLLLGIGAGLLAALRLRRKKSAI
jgi:hypothetical protein